MMVRRMLRQKFDYSNLERSLIDVIKEEQAKLGYYREDIRLVVF